MTIKLWPDREIRVEKKRVGRVPVLILRPAQPAAGKPGVLWIHGGGYLTGENICIDGGMTRLMIYHGEHGWSYAD